MKHVSLSPDREFRIRSLDCVRANSTSPVTRGIAILIKNPFIYSMLDLSNKFDASIEAIDLQLQYNSSTFNVVDMYRPP